MDVIYQKSHKVVDIMREKNSLFGVVIPWDLFFCRNLYISRE